MPDSSPLRLFNGLLFAALLTLFFVSPSFACGCDGGSIYMPFQKRYERADAVLLGILREQSTLTNLYPPGHGRNQRIKYFTFHLLKYSKYSKPCGDIVTLFDSGTDSSCEGFLEACKIGDTVLVYCRVGETYITGSPVFHGNMCEPYSIIPSIAPGKNVQMKVTTEELGFIGDESKWKSPLFQVKRFGASQNQPYTDIPIPSILVPCLDKWLIVSAILNAFLIFLLLRKKNKRN